MAHRRKSLGAGARLNGMVWAKFGPRDLETEETIIQKRSLFDSHRRSESHQLGNCDCLKTAGPERS